MSNANVSFVQGLYAAFGRGEIETVVKAMAPNATWRLEGRRQDNPLLGDWHGPAGVRDFFKTLAEGQEALEFAPRDFYPSGDKVFVLGHYAWKAKKSGKTAASAFCHIFTVKDGKVAAFHEFTDTAQFAELYK